MSVTVGRHKPGNHGLCQRIKHYLYLSPLVLYKTSSHKMCQIYNQS